MSSLIDPETNVIAVQSYYNQRSMHLVMSDEFNIDGRAFTKGSDPLFEAIQKPDYTNEALQFYNSSTDYVTTRKGNLVITTRAVKTNYFDYDGDGGYITRTKNYTSGMVQTWNKFCFTGGILEMSIRLPGKSNSGGIWPAAWLMGNLARATFDSTTLNVWPWSYDTCGQIENISTKQLINACDGNPGYGMNPFQGRGAPEIDIFEVMPGHEMPGLGEVPAFMSTSLQIAPGISKSRGPRPMNGEPLNASQLWYPNLVLGPTGRFNDGFWGQECGIVLDPTPEQIHKYMEDAISVNTNLNETHFESHHVYRLEWEPGADGRLFWYLDEELLFGIEGSSINSMTGALIPEEPMYLILNTALSHRWGMPEPCDNNTCSVCWRCFDCHNPECQCTLPNGMKNCKNLPAEMQIDYIRLYQDPINNAHTVGCSTKSFPTADYISAHQDMFSDWVPIEANFWSEQSIVGFGFSQMQIIFALLLALMMLLITLLLRHKNRVRSQSPSQDTSSNRYASIKCDQEIDVERIQLSHYPAKYHIEDMDDVGYQASVLS